MCRYFDVKGETGLKTVSLKGMEANVRLTVQPSTGPGDASTSALLGLSGGFYFIVHVSFRLCALCKSVMHGYKG